MQLKFFAAAAVAVGMLSAAPAFAGDGFVDGSYANLSVGGGSGSASMVAFKPIASGGGGDLTPPSTPTGLSATAISSSQINLSWTASTDNVGVTGYKIFRGGVQIGTSATNNYTDTGLTASTMYTYTVAAYDAVPNTSPTSSPAFATTQASPPTV
jgi:cellulose 1,4-beta-cellobiosidase